VSCFEIVTPLFVKIVTPLFVEIVTPLFIETQRPSIITKIEITVQLPLGPCTVAYDNIMYRMSRAQKRVMMM
jgi:hypothetical protein